MVLTIPAVMACLFVVCGVAVLAGSILGAAGIVPLWPQLPLARKIVGCTLIVVGLAAGAITLVMALEMIRSVRLLWRLKSAKQPYSRDVRDTGRPMSEAATNDEVGRKRRLRFKIGLILIAVSYVFLGAVFIFGAAALGGRVWPQWAAFISFVVSWAIFLLGLLLAGAEAARLVREKLLRFFRRGRVPPTKID